MYCAGNYDILVIGAGHAGCESALAAARLGLRTVCFAINLDSVGNMPCNPAIGGTGKGHLVREIDALGGEMARAADKTAISCRMLNRGKGPAVHSLRAQIDRRAYQALIKQTLESQENLDLKQAEIVEITSENGAVTGAVTRTGAFYAARAVIIATGTYLGGRTIVGETVRSGGPDGMFAANALTENLRALDLRLLRFKT
ncbi:MAG: FAD-dependent oxidoreductase, partial [Oscillospiraceae bacterium]|nr:FAD-dependent oxidoreductase [Oscillospiraceae bacterium]